MIRFKKCHLIFYDLVTLSTNIFLYNDIKHENYILHEFPQYRRQHGIYELYVICARNMLRMLAIFKTSIIN